MDFKRYFQRLKEFPQQASESLPFPFASGRKEAKRISRNDLAVISVLLFL
jgi:hypothetical protein